MSSMNTVLFVNATVGFSKNLFPVGTDANNFKKGRNEILGTKHFDNYILGQY